MGEGFRGGIRCGDLCTQRFGAAGGLGQRRRVRRDRRCRASNAGRACLARASSSWRRRRRWSPARTGWRLRYLSMPPTKSPISISAVSGRAWSFCTAASELAPVEPAMWARPAARATSMPRWIEWIQAEQEYGTTMPVVPRIESPPTMPSRPLSVFAASAPPPGIAISTSTSPLACAAAATSAMAVADHLARHRIDGGLARRDREPRPRDDADPFAGAEDDAAARHSPTHGRKNEGAVGHVGIVAGILDDARGRGVRAHAGDCQRETGTLALGQRHLDRIGECAGQQRRIGGLGGRSGAGAGGPAAAKRRGLLGHAASVGPRTHAADPWIVPAPRPASGAREKSRAGARRP